MKKQQLCSFSIVMTANLVFSIINPVFAATPAVVPGTKKTASQSATKNGARKSGATSSGTKGATTKDADTKRGTTSSTKSATNAATNSGAMDEARRHGAPISTTEILPNGKPTPAGELFIKGWIAQTKQNNLVLAKKCYSEGLQLNPKSASCHLGMAELSFRKQRYKEGAKYLDLAISLDPKYVQAMIGQGLRYQRKGDYARAIKCFSIGVDTAPDKIELYRLRGMAYLEQGDVAAARADLKTAQSKAPEDPETVLLSAELGYYDGQYPSVIQKCNYLVNAGRANAAVYLLRSNARMRTFDFLNAKCDLKLAESLGYGDTKWEQERITDFEYDHLHAETDPAKKWVLACSAPMFEFNNTGFESLSGEPLIPDRRADQQRTLNEWWGISNKWQLESTVKKLTEGKMHHAQWLEWWHAYKADPSGFEQKHQGNDRLNLMKLYGDKFGERGILAWDLGRAICLCRWGYAAGYISEDEAFNLMLPAAMRIQKNYSSWNEFVETYFLGRRFWNIEYYLENEHRSNRTIQTLKMNPNGLCKVPWKTNLVYAQTKTKAWAWPWEAK